MVSGEKLRRKDSEREMVKKMVMSLLQFCSYRVAKRKNREQCLPRVCPTNKSNPIKTTPYDTLSLKCSVEGPTLSTQTLINKSNVNFKPPNNMILYFMLSVSKELVLSAFVGENPTFSFFLFFVAIQIHIILVETNCCSIPFLFLKYHNFQISSLMVLSHI